MGMSKIEVRLSHPHRHADEEARARLERLMDRISGTFPGYNLQRTWADDAKKRVTFTFAKAGKGEGTGSAELLAGRVDVILGAMYNLPFLVPVAFAQKLVRDQVTKALDETFGPPAT